MKMLPNRHGDMKLTVVEEMMYPYVYILSLIFFFGGGAPIVLIFLFTISKFVLLLRLHFFYAKTGISQVKLGDNDPTGQEFLQHL